MVVLWLTGRKPYLTCFNGFNGLISRISMLPMDGGHLLPERWTPCRSSNAANSPEFRKSSDAFLQAVSWFTIASVPPSSISFFTITINLLLGNLGAAIVEVANEGCPKLCSIFKGFFYFNGFF
ncbi:hypothetical protein L2E82_22872 [Cichorium intybus]|uniref:Uncharacterized protein n=1 Tax=Cichorium intybus TaxID=13427 RepID=A0ACB9DZZ4_CICIN|nr:hypothetical protein L2E82_22872 [Cichorium intybus]